MATVNDAGVLPEKQNRRRHHRLFLGQCPLKPPEWEMANDAETGCCGGTNGARIISRANYFPTRSDGARSCWSAGVMLQIGYGAAVKENWRTRTRHFVGSDFGHQ